ncbi:MAG: M55 family metallopeptidase, partial [bacterium]|nr:M55 family metallopeptidase [bacterium]
EWAYSGLADCQARFAGVQRVDARTVAWKIYDPRDIYMFPSESWQPGTAYEANGRTARHESTAQTNR